MKRRKNLLQHKYWWALLLVAFITITYLSTLVHFRFDLTAEKRFSLGNATKQLLQNIDSTITIKVFLTGDLPADYKKLSIAAEDLLYEFKEESHNEIKVVFEKPGEGMDDSSRFKLYDSLQQMGVVFEQNENSTASQDKATQQLIIPSALVLYKNFKPIAIDLRSSRTIFKNFNVSVLYKWSSDFS